MVPFAQAARERRTVIPHANYEYNEVIDMICAGVELY